MSTRKFKKGGFMVQIGKIYTVNHCRKGIFHMQITAINGEWIAGIVINGTANARRSYNNKYSGDEIMVKEKFCLFTEFKEAIDSKEVVNNSTQNIPSFQY